MHFFRFQRTWFHRANQGRPCSGYYTISTIKGTLRHSKCGGEGGEKNGDSYGRKNGEFKGSKGWLLEL